ncbi:MAG: hypothetical protein HQ519_00140 [Planctomycetes bacterium]|nr:hypothetical protein [Planctomycetota bacterium]
MKLLPSPLQESQACPQVRSIETITDFIYSADISVIAWHYLMIYIFISVLQSALKVEVDTAGKLKTNPRIALSVILYLAFGALTSGLKGIGFQNSLYLSAAILPLLAFLIRESLFSNWGISKRLFSLAIGQGVEARRLKEKVPDHPRQSIGFENVLEIKPEMVSRNSLAVIAKNQGLHVNLIVNVSASLIVFFNLLEIDPLIAFSFLVMAFFSIKGPLKKLSITLNRCRNPIEYQMEMFLRREIRPDERSK